MGYGPHLEWETRASKADQQVTANAAASTVTVDGSNAIV